MARHSYEDGYAYCSRCREWITPFDAYAYNMRCPRCGLKIRGDQHAVERAITELCRRILRVV